MYNRIFIDTNPIVYLIGNQLPYSLKVRDFLSHEMFEGAEFYTSTITDTEFLAKPYKMNDYEAVEAYREFLERLNVLKCYVNEPIAVTAAKIRAQYDGIKTADSIQLAASIESRCDCFFTNDAQLRQVIQANVVYLGDL